jgi:hypothetical protein
MHLTIAAVHIRRQQHPTRPPNMEKSMTFKNLTADRERGGIGYVVGAGRC